MNTEDIESLLECSVCLEQLDASHKVLPCQHTFCLRCLEGITRKSRGEPCSLCPECRSEFNTPLEKLPSNIILNRILESLTNKSSPKSSTTPTTTTSPAAGSKPPSLLPEICSSKTLPSLPPKPPSRAHQVYRALYDYKPCQVDELELKKSQLYIVIEKRRDAWFKGYSIQTLKTGFFPGNYVMHVRNEKKTNETREEVADLIDLRSEETSTQALSRSAAIDTKSNPLPPSSMPRIPPPPQNRPSPIVVREKLKCIMAFPASGIYELSMEEGDIIILISKRDDGWCKGTLERTGQVGLFPFSFVKVITH